MIFYRYYIRVIHTTCIFIFIIARVKQNTAFRYYLLHHDLLHETPDANKILPLVHFVHLRQQNLRPTFLHHIQPIPI